MSPKPKVSNKLKNLGYLNFSIIAPASGKYYKQLCRLKLFKKTSTAVYSRQPVGFPNFQTPTISSIIILLTPVLCIGVILPFFNFTVHTNQGT